MGLTRLRPVYEYEGLFATVYLEGRSPGEDAAEQLRELAEQESTRTAQERAEQLNAGLVHGRAVHGDQSVAQAAEMGVVDTLLLEYGTSLEREALLLKACADTSARVDLVEAGTGLTGGVGALLRFPLHS